MAVLTVAIVVVGVLGYLKPPAPIIVPAPIVNVPAPPAPVVTVQAVPISVTLDPSEHPRRSK